MPIILDFIAGRRPPDLYQDYLSTLFEPWSDVLVDAAPPSEDVVDIACGSGIVSRKLARQSAVRSVEAIDVAPPMIEKAKSLTPTDAAITFQLASAEELPFADNQFQAAYCQQGLQFFPNKAGALREAARVVAPGGKLAFAVWTSAGEGNPVFGAFEDIIAQDLGEDLVPFGPFSFGDLDKVRAVADEAGLKDAKIERVECVTKLPDPRTLVLFDLLFLGRPGPDGTLQPLFDPSDASNDDLIEDLVEKFEPAVRSYQQADGSLLAPSAAHVLIAEIS